MYYFKALWKEIKDVLYWVMKEPFWSTRITTGDKFKNKFSDLLMNSKTSDTQSAQMSAEEEDKLFADYANNKGE